MSGPTSILYETQATSIGGRDGGKVGLSEGSTWFAMAHAKGLGGSGLGTNPEQLFALGYASCFNSAVLFVAARDHKDASKAQVTCKVGIGRNEGGGFALAATLSVHLPGMDQAEAEALVEAAHHVCPYSNATRGNVPVTLVVTV